MGEKDMANNEPGSVPITTEEQPKGAEWIPPRWNDFEQIVEIEIRRTE